MANAQCDKLKKGVLLDGNKLWKLDDENRRTVELFSRALNITWGSTSQYWNYESQRLSGGEYIQVAELLNVCWLEIEGQLDTRLLTPRTEYEVLFDFQLTAHADGFALPVKFTLIAPCGRKFEFDKSLGEFRGRGWTQLSIGKFQTPTWDPRNNQSKVEFRIYEHVNGRWKSGLIVRGVIIRPTMAPTLTTTNLGTDQRGVWREVLILTQNDV